MIKREPRKNGALFFCAGPEPALRHVLTPCTGVAQSVDYEVFVTIRLYIMYDATPSDTRIITAM